MTDDPTPNPATALSNPWAPIPTSFFRGLRKSGLWTTDTCNALAFEPDKKTAELRVQAGKSDGEEVSVNWGDSDGAKSATFADRVNSKYGAVLVDLNGCTQHLHNVLPHLTAETDPLPHNSHHGNIVFSRKMPVRLRKLSLVMFATYASFLPPPDTNSSNAG